jgi:hypothetical protein
LAARPQPSQLVPKVDLSAAAEIPVVAVEVLVAQVALAQASQEVLQASESPAQSLVFRRHSEPVVPVVLAIPHRL